MTAARDAIPTGVVVPGDAGDPLFRTLEHSS